MTDPKVLFVLYYKSPPHTDALIDRATEQLTDLHYVHAPATGPPAQTLNEVLNGLWGKTEWVVPFDPHLRWDDVDQFLVDLRLADGDPRVGYISYPVYQHGPQQPPQLAQWLGSPQYSIFRLLAAFRVDALKSCGGFQAATSGRNWMWKTEMAINDQGWRHMDGGVVVANHHDPELTLEQHLLNAYWSGRDALDLYQHGRGHPLIHEGTQQLAGKVALCDKQNWDNVYYQCLELLRLLGGGLALDRLPREAVRPATIQTVIHEHEREAQPGVY